MPLDARTEAWARLVLLQFPAATIAALLRAFGSAQGIFAATRSPDAWILDTYRPLGGCGRSIRPGAAMWRRGPRMVRRAGRWRRYQTAWDSGELSQESSVDGQPPSLVQIPTPETGPDEIPLAPPECWQADARCFSMKGTCTTSE